MLVSKVARMVVALAGAAVLMVASASAQNMHMTKAFSGAKVNAGTVTHSEKAGKHVLTLSADFQMPDTPDPHWQVVDAKGKTFLLDRLAIKGDKVNMSITLPDYVQNVAKVQIYCAWAEAVLGEAPFASALNTH